MNLHDHTVVARQSLLWEVLQPPCQVFIKGGKAGVGDRDPFVGIYTYPVDLVI